VFRRMWGWFGHIPWSLVGINSTFVGSSWPPDVLVLLWPTLFSGDERGGVDQQTGQRILEVTLFVLADAGLLQLYVAESGTSRWRLARQPWVFPGASPGAPRPPSPGARPWLSEVLLEHVRANPGISCAALVDGWGYTEEAAVSCGYASVVGRRWFSRLVLADEEVARSESAARSLAHRWTTFTRQHERLYRLMWRTTRPPEGGGG